MGAARSLGRHWLGTWFEAKQACGVGEMAHRYALVARTAKGNTAEPQQVGTWRMDGRARTHRRGILLSNPLKTKMGMGTWLEACRVGEMASRQGSQCFTLPLRLPQAEGSADYLRSRSRSQNHVKFAGCLQWTLCFFDIIFWSLVLRVFFWMHVTCDFVGHASRYGQHKLLSGHTEASFELPPRTVIRLTPGVLMDSRLKENDIYIYYVYRYTDSWCILLAVVQEMDETR